MGREVTRPTRHPDRGKPNPRPISPVTTEQNRELGGMRRRDTTPVISRFSDREGEEQISLHPYSILVFVSFSTVPNSFGGGCLSMVFTQPVSAVAIKAWPGHKRHPYKLAWYRRSRGGYRDLSSARFDSSFILAIYIYNEAIPGVVQRYSAGKRYRSTDSEKNC